MQSANWCFSMPLCKKQVKRFWPLWGMYTFVLFMLMPVYLLLEKQNEQLGQDLYLALHRYGIVMATEGALWIALFFCVLTAMALWSYLYNNRSVSMIHALPMTRETLFITNYITGILFFLVPNLVIFLLTLGAEALIGVVAIKSLAIWLLCQTLLCFFYYSFATVLAFVTGHILILPCLYAVFNFLTFALSRLLDWSFGEFVYGYAIGSVPLLNWFGKWLSPAYAFLDELHLEYPVIDGQTIRDLPAMISGLPLVFAYAAVGLIMTFVAYLFYRNRKLELSGEVIVVSFLRPIFKYGVAICSGLVFGNIFYQILPGLFFKEVISLLFFLLLWGVIGYFAAEMLLRKSFRVIRQSYKGCLFVILILSAAILAMEWDVSGYEKLVPNADQVESVSISNRGNMLIHDTESIANVLALQKTLIEEKAQIERWERGADPEIQTLIDQSVTQNGIYLEKFTWSNLSLEYKLKDGRSLRREYRIPITEALMEQEGISAARYERLVNNPKLRLQSTFPDMLKAEELVQIEVHTTNEISRDRGKETSYAATESSKAIFLSGEDAQTLYQAVREDIQAGRLEKQWLLQNEESLKTNYINTIYFTFRGDYNTDNRYEGDWYQKQDRKGSNAVYYEVELTVQSTATSTLSVLEQLGLMDSIQFVSEYDWQWDEYKNGAYLYGKD